MHRKLALARVAAALVVALTVALIVAPVAHADLTTGRDKLIAETKAPWPSCPGGRADRAEARLLLARAQLETGDYPAAESSALALAQAKDAVAPRARLFLAQVRRVLGKQAEASRDLEALVKERPDDRAARLWAALLRKEQGDRKGAEALWQLTIDDFDARKIDFDDPDEVYILAETARHMAQFQLANDSYREAAKLRPQFTEASVAGLSCSSRSTPPTSPEQTLEEVFKVNPNHADGHAMMAAVILEKSYDLSAVRHHLEAAFAVNPRQLRGLRCASIEIDQNQWQRARHRGAGGRDQPAPAGGPGFARHHRLAARRSRWRYEADRKRVLQRNPTYAEFYRIVARSAVREHRYLAAVELQKEAVKLDPTAYAAMAEIGMGYLRLGIEAEGVDWLKKAWAGDKYNVRTFNTKNLFRRTIPKDYTFQTTRSFKIRYQNDERAVLSRYLEPTMEKAFSSMVARYGFTPKTPVVLELYADREDYAIRTVGLPDLGALGVCLGQVITAMSPANGDINQHGALA
ncbi:MAG: hypothetical protein IPI49_33350 [Myxococcales bacterium]|nr:hypothetical protein [Myxococcales bacterium]